MSETLTTKEFSQKYGPAESTIRKWIKQNLVSITYDEINGKNTRLIIVDDKAQRLVDRYRGSVQRSAIDSAPDFIDISHNTPHSANKQVDSAPVEEAEIITEATGYNMVSMENTTFEQLINNIQKLADDKSQVEQKAYDRLEKEYHELKAKCDTLEQENKKLIHENAELETNYKIAQLRAEEHEEKLKKAEDDIKNLNEKSDQTSIWFKKL